MSNDRPSYHRNRSFPIDFIFSFLLTIFLFVVISHWERKVHLHMMSKCVFFCFEWSTRKILVKFYEKKKKKKQHWRCKIIGNIFNDVNKNNLLLSGWFISNYLRIKLRFFFLFRKYSDRLVFFFFFYIKNENRFKVKERKSTFFLIQTYWLNNRQK